MRYQSIIILVFILGIFQVNAQNDFRKGYIITNNNDTLYGFIDYRGNASNAHECIYKPDLQAEKLNYTPVDIKGYRFTDSKFYVSRYINTGEKEEHIFLEFLINGIVNVYYYRDFKREHYLIEKDKGQFLNLKDEPKEVTVGSTMYIRESKKFRGILKYLLNDSPKIGSEIDNTELNHKSLIKLVNDYHYQVCNDRSCIIYERKPTKIKIGFGPLLGYNTEILSAHNSTFDDLYYFKNSNFSVATYPSFGFFFKVNIPYFNEHLFFQYEGTFSKSLSKSVNPVNLYDNLYASFSINRQAYNQSFMLRYEFTGNKIRPVFQIGFFDNRYINTSVCDIYLHFNDGSSSLNKTITIYPNVIFVKGLSVGAGLIAKVLHRDAFLDVKYQSNLSPSGGRYGQLPNLASDIFSVNLSISLLK